MVTPRSQQRAASLAGGCRTEHPPQIPPRALIRSFISPQSASNGPNPLPAQPTGPGGALPAVPSQRPCIVRGELPPFIPALLPGASPEREGILSIANKNAVQIILK